MKKQFKFKDEHYAMRCNVRYIYPLTIVGYDKESKLVKVAYNHGNYDRVVVFVPEKDIELEK